MGWEPSSVKHGYAHAVALLETSEEKQRHVYAILRYGGNGGTLNVEVKGEPSAAFASWCRSDHPTHRVSRVDVCIDLAGVGLFESGDRALSAILAEYGLRSKTEGDWKTGVHGRSLYLGAPKSNVQLVWYEKGKQLAENGMVGSDPNHCRLEIRVKCRKLLKDYMAKMDHADVWGISEWTAAALRSVSGLDAERVALSVYRRPDHDRAMHWLARQYGETMIRDMRLRGGWEAFGQHIEAAVSAGLGSKVIRRKAALPSSGSAVLPGQSLTEEPYRKTA